MQFSFQHHDFLLASTSTKLWSEKFPRPTCTQWLFRLFFAAVRYGRVPKRTRDIGGNSIVEDLANGLVTSNNQQSIVLTGVRVVNSVTSSSPTAQSTAPIVTSTYLSASNGSSGGGQTTLVSSQMCSTTTMIEASHNKPGNICEASHNNNNNNNSDEQELSVYDVILCVSQAHRTHCTYTENVRKVLNNQSPSTMPTHHPSSASTINTNNLISSSTAAQNNSMDDNGVSLDGAAPHAVAAFNYSQHVTSRLPHQLLRVWNISEFISGNSTPWEWHREFTLRVRSRIDFNFRYLTD